MLGVKVTMFFFFYLSMDLCSIHQLIILSSHCSVVILCWSRTLQKREGGERERKEGGERERERKEERKRERREGREREGGTGEKGKRKGGRERGEMGQ